MNKKKTSCSPKIKSSRRVKINDKISPRNQKKSKPDAKKKMKKKIVDENEEWSVGVNARAKAKTESLEQKRKEAERRREAKMRQKMEEDHETFRIRQLRKEKGRSKSLGQDPITPRSRRARSSSIDETKPEWKTRPKLTRRQSEERDTQKIKLNIVTVDGQESLLSLPKTSTVHGIKLKIEQLRGIPAVGQELLSLSRRGPLIDGHKLGDLNLENGSTIICTNHEGTLHNWATFHHFRSPQKPKRHVEFGEDDRTATKTAAHPQATYVFTSGAVNGARSAGDQLFELEVDALQDESQRMAIGLFQGRNLKLEEDPFPVGKRGCEWGATTGAGAVDSQSPLWCVSSHGKFRTPQEHGWLPARREWNERRFGTGDTIQVVLRAERQELEFYVRHTGQDQEDQVQVESVAGLQRPETPKAASQRMTEDDTEVHGDENEFEHLYTLQLGPTGAVADDLHLFAALYGKGDSVTIKKVTEVA